MSDENSEKLYKVDDGCVVWWVSAYTETDAVLQVIDYEKRGGCDIIAEGYWTDFGVMGTLVENLVTELDEETANKIAFYNEELDTISNMWDEFIKNPSIGVLACSEW